MNAHHSFALWYANFGAPQQEVTVTDHPQEGDGDIWFGTSGPEAACAAEDGAAADAGDSGETRE